MEGVCIGVSRISECNPFTPFPLSIYRPRIRVQGLVPLIWIVYFGQDRTPGVSRCVTRVSQMSGGGLCQYEAGVWIEMGIIVSIIGFSYLSTSIGTQDWDGSST